MKKTTNFVCNAYATGMISFKGTSTTSDNNIISYHRIDENSIAEDLNSYDMGKYTIMEIASWFLSKQTMTHLKLQKLCYYAQAWFYALKKIRLIDTDFQAWVHGPVAPDLYEKFKCFGYSGIRLAGEYVSEIESEDVELLESVWETYGDKTGNALEALTHTERPWLDAREGYAADERCSVVIAPESMEEYYSSIYIGGEA